MNRSTCPTGLQLLRLYKHFTLLSSLCIPLFFQCQLISNCYLQNTRQLNLLCMVIPYYALMYTMPRRGRFSGVVHLLVEVSSLQVGQIYSQFIQLHTIYTRLEILGVRVGHIFGHIYPHQNWTNMELFKISVQYIFALWIKIYWKLTLKARSRFVVFRTNLT